MSDKETFSLSRMLSSREGVETALHMLLSEENIDVPAVRRLLSFVALEQPDYIDLFPNIALVERREDRPEGEDCFHYVFGNEDIQSTMDTVFATHTRVEALNEGDLVLYFNPIIQPTHVGRAVDTTVVRSKWGLHGHVFDHAPYLVPDLYGNIVIFYRPPEQDGS